MERLGPETVDGVAVGDKALEAFEKGVEISHDIEVITYDDVQINEDEKEALSLPPEHQIYPRIIAHDIGVELEKCLIKSAWDESRNRKLKELELAAAESDDTLVRDDGTPFDAHKVSSENQGLNSLTLTNIRSTAWKNIKRVKFIDEIDDTEAARKLFIKDELMKTAKEYIKTHCRSNGKLLEHNLNDDQENSLKILKTRIKNENICVYETDKTSKFVVDTLSNVENKMKKHLEDDLVISDKKIRNIERKLNFETEDWIEILQIGRDVNQLKRTKFNLKSTNNPIPILRGTSKDHKKAIDPKIGPDLRPIMGARVGPNTSLAQIACKIVRAISESVPNTHATKSTEELIRTFEITMIPE